VAEDYYPKNWLCDCADQPTTIPEFAKITVAGE
jgi:hypothetical protein